MNQYTYLLFIVVSFYAEYNTVVSAQLHIEVSRSQETTFTCVCFQGDASSQHSARSVEWDTDVRTRRTTSTMFFALNGTTLSPHNTLGLPQYSEWDFEYGSVAQFTLNKTTPFYGVFECKSNATGSVTSSEFALVYVPLYSPSSYSVTIIVIIICSALFILLLVSFGVSLICCCAKYSRQANKHWSSNNGERHIIRKAGAGTKSTTRYQGHFNATCKDGVNYVTDFRTGQKTDTIKDGREKATKLTGNCSPMRCLAQLDHIQYIDPPEDVEFDSNGGRYINEDHEVELRVPQLAVPPGIVITVRIGISLTTPIHFPNGIKPVSPIVHVCVLDEPNFKFSKPVEVIVPHFLSVNGPSELNSSAGLQFVKANHSQFVFTAADGEAQFEVGKSYGTLLTDHFCHICIASKVTNLSMVNFRLIRVIPRSLSIAWNAHFCVTYFLRSCLRAVEKQFDAHDYEVQSLKRFSFSDSFPNGPIKILFEKKLDGWNLTQAGCSSKISASDVDFWRIPKSELEQMEKERLYPPRFVIRVNGRQATEARNITIHFTGAKEDFQTELLLEPVVPQAPSPLNYARIPRSYSDNITEVQRRHLAPGYAHRENGNGSIYSSTGSLTVHSPPSHVDLMNNIAAYIPTKWRSVGIQLGISMNKLDQIEHDHLHDSNRRFSEVFRHWERQPDNVLPYEWSSVIEALNSRQVCENKLASDMSKLLTGKASMSSLAVSVCDHTDSSTD